MIRTLIRTNRKLLIWTVLFIIVVTGALAVWYKNVYSNPRNVFQAMLENSLRTRSVTKQVLQGDQTQTLDQRLRLKTGETHAVHGVTTLSQSGQASATVVTESIGTPTSDYVRYRSIETNQKGLEGNDLDFSEVLNVWGRTEGGNETAGELYNETVLGVIPFGNLSAADRDKLLDLIAEFDVYKVEYANVTRLTVNGRPTYEYTVKVLPSAYVTLLKAYAQMAGLTHLQNIDPAAYANAEALEFKLTVDVMTRRLAGITYANGRSERYLSYGSHEDVEKPKDTVSVEELQQRIQQVQ